VVFDAVLIRAVSDAAWWWRSVSRL
jgi:hypothetical protein